MSEINIDAETFVCATLGNPNRASMAPTLHNAGFKALGLKYAYVVFEPDDIGAAMDAVRAFKMPGVSVTAPYKEAVLPYLDEIDPVAQKIGAVNAVRNQNSRLVGYNCDWIGVAEALKEVTQLQDKEVAVLGAGGAARAVVFALQKNGAKVIVFNRTAERGQKLADDMGVQFGGSLENIGNLNPTVLVNATKAGMGDGASVQVAGSVLKTVDVVMDVVVKPRHTALLTAAAKHGCKTVEGARMLVLQGAFAFELFTGQKAPLDAMDKAVMAAIG